MGTRGHNYLKSNGHPDQIGVYATGTRGESHAPYPGRATALPVRQVSLRDDTWGGMQSAEAIVAAAQR
jgi:hypothetical protein